MAKSRIEFSSSSLGSTRRTNFDESERRVGASLLDLLLLAAPLDATCVLLADGTSAETVCRLVTLAEAANKRLLLVGIAEVCWADDGVALTGDVSTSTRLSLASSEPVSTYKT